MFTTILLEIYGTKTRRFESCKGISRWIRLLSCEATASVPRSRRKRNRNSCLLAFSLHILGSLDLDAWGSGIIYLWNRLYIMTMRVSESLFNFQDVGFPINVLLLFHFISNIKLAVQTTELISQCPLTLSHCLRGWEAVHCSSIVFPS